MNPCATQLIQRVNKTNGARLWIVDENISSETIAQIQPDPQLSAITNRYDIAEQLKLRGINTLLNDFELNQCSPIATVIYQVSKERALVQHCIFSAASLLEANGRLYLVGEKNTGVKTHGKFAEQLCRTKMSMEKHGLCYLVTISKTKNINANDFDDTYPVLRPMQIGDFQFYSKPGVYGWKKIDVGSHLLLAKTKPILQNIATENLSVLDIGCGYGYLTVNFADLPFRKRIATDNNVAAVMAAERNFLERGLSVETVLDDCGRHLTEKVDVILCNPPFHQGFEHDKTLITRFVNASLNLLANNGMAFFVVNEFIPLSKVITQTNGLCELLAHEQGFKVYCVSRNRKDLDALAKVDPKTDE